LPRGAVAALEGIELDEGCLHGVEFAGLSETFDGGDALAGMHHGEGEARVHAASIDVDGACAALAVVAAFLGAGKVEVLAKTVEKRGAWIDLKVVVLSIHVERDWDCA
jgi:hypothetical protein